MRIAYVCADPGIPVFGCKGCSLHVQEMLRALVNLGMNVTLFAAKQGGDPPGDLRKITCHILPPQAQPGQKPDRAQREQQAMDAHDWFLQALQQEGDFDLVYERYSLWSHAGTAYASRHAIPSVLEVNAPLMEEAKNYRGLIHEQQARQIARQNFQRASLICCVSQAVADYVQSFAPARGRGKAALPAIVTPNAVNPRRFAAFSTARAPREHSADLVIGFMGTLKPWHGIDYLLHAFARFQQENPSRKARLLIIGDGPQRAAMEELARQLHIDDRIQSTGAVAPDDVPGWLEKMDIAVAPYPPLENFYFSPLKVFEYMAAGLPVIASDMGQIKDLVQHGENGLRVPPGSVMDLTEALQFLADHPQQAAQMGRRARQYILEHYTWDTVAQRVLTQCLDNHEKNAGLARPATQRNAN
ncbi:glycosyltransferase family 4 protein [Thiolapillus sp.]